MRVLGVFVALLAIKASLFAIDPTIRLYLGDSAAYLYGAMDDGRLPDDRSFTYSFIIRALVRPFDRLTMLGVWQSLAGVMIAGVLYHSLRSRFGVSPGLAAVAAFAIVLEPLQLYYERMVLAETAGLLAFVTFYACASAYLASLRVWWLPLVACCGLAAVTLRLNYLPVVLVISLALPLCAFVQSPRRGAWRVAAHFAVALAAVATLHGAYIYWVGQIFSVPPGYLARAGFMQLGLVTPLVTSEHLAAAGLPPDLERALRYPLADPHARMRHMWSPGGLVRELRDRRIPIEPVARRLSRMAIADDPIGLVRLGLFTVGDYFRPEQIAHALNNDLGQRRIPPEVLWSLREDWGYDATGLETKVTTVSRYFEWTTWWMVASLFVLPVAALANAVVHWRTPARRQALLAALVGVGLVMAHVLFVPVAFYRYLHPLPFFVLLNAVPLVARFRRETGAAAEPV